ncbi:unnamed protein product [Lupinus luteus]|uniref:VQ domain-containing protein n=1 Tax=Lupinus luteus TaxID=3873 RepID=A0AAV1WEP1_LUPLU
MGNDVMKGLEECFKLDFLSINPLQSHHYIFDNLEKTVMDNKGHQSQTFFTTNTNNAPSCYTNGPYLRQLNKNSNKISKPISKILPKNIPITKKQLDDYENMFTQLNPPPLVYKIKKSEFKEFVQKVTGCTPKVTTAQPPSIKQPNPPNTLCFRRQPPPPNTTFHGSNNPINHINNDIVVAPQPMFPQASSYPSVSVGAESPINPYMWFVNNTVMSSQIPLMYPNVLFPHDQVGFPRWNDVQI